MTIQRFEYRDDQSFKFWEIQVVGSKTLVRFGRVGTGGQNVAKQHASPKAAQAEADRLIREKKGKGYVKSSPLRTTPKKASPKKATPKKASPKKATPKKASPKKATPKKASPKKASPKASPKKASPKKASPKKASPKKASDEKSSEPLYSQVFTRKKVQGAAIVRKKVGSVLLPSGVVVVADPLSSRLDNPLARSVPKGRYDVVVAVAKVKGGLRVAAAMLRITADAPARWEVAQFRGQRAKPGFEPGYPVDAGVGCFMDKVAAEKMEKEHEVAMDREDWAGGVTAQALTKKLHGSAASAEGFPESSPDANVIAFSAGLGDGAYASYWGLGSRGKPVCLVTNFGLFGGDDEDGE